MPPEQFTGSPIDGRADLFSLGVILYSLATGEQPFPGETMTAVSYKVVYTEPIPPAKLNPAIPARVEAVILKCLAKSPADRYQTGEELAQDLATVRMSPVSSVMQSSPLAPSAMESDATLGPNAVSGSLRPAQAQVITADKSGSRPVQGPSAAGAAAKPAAVKTGKAKQFESVFAIALLSVAGLGAAIAGGWYWYAHRKPPAPAQQAVTIPMPQPQPQQIEPLPETQPPAAGPETTPAKPGAAPKSTNPPATKPSPGKPTGSKTVTPPAPQPVAVVTPPAPAKPDQNTSAPVKPPTPAPAAAAFDPRKADPNKNGKLKIDVSKFPKGISFTVSMNKQPYLHFVTGDGTSLDNLYAPPGMQQFQVSFKSGGQEWDSKPVSSDFKAKKTKTLKVQLFEGDNAESKITVPIAKDALLAISFSSSITNLF